MLPFRQKLMKFFTFFLKWKIWLSAIDIELFEKLNLRGVRWFGQHGGKYGHFLPFPDNGFFTVYFIVSTRARSLSIKEPFIKYVRKFNSSIYGKDSRKYAKKKQEVQQEVRNGKSPNPNPIESLLTCDVE